MNKKFIKKYWEEENILFYLHFENGNAVRQIEITPDTKILTSEDNHIQGESFLYDQSLDELDLESHKKPRRSAKNNQF